MPTTVTRSAPERVFQHALDIMSVSTTDSVKVFFDFFCYSRLYVAFRIAEEVGDDDTVFCDIQYCVFEAE